MQFSAPHFPTTHQGEFVGTSRSSAIFPLRTMSRYNREFLFPPPAVAFAKAGSSRKRKCNTCAQAPPTGNARNSKPPPRQTPHRRPTLAPRQETANGRTRKTSPGPQPQPRFRPRQRPTSSSPSPPQRPTPTSPINLPALCASVPKKTKKNNYLRNDLSTKRPHETPITLPPRQRHCRIRKRIQVDDSAHRPVCRIDVLLLRATAN
jgi:hypothetical protein